MPFNVNDILAQKISEIQSRVPLRMNTFQAAVPFSRYLEDAMDSGGAVDKQGVLDKQGIDRSSDVERAKANLTKSTASIPNDKSELMKTINSNIQTSSKKYGVDTDLVRAVIRQESDYDPYSLSHTGAQGLMQLMPGTADALHVNDPWDISQNIDGGTRYLKDQLDTFNGNVRLALAAYNAGPEAVNKYGGIPPYEETRDYVNMVMKYYREYTGNL